MYKGINYLDYYVKIDIQLEKLTNGKWLEYTGKIKISSRRFNDDKRSSSFITMGIEKSSML